LSHQRLSPETRSQRRAGSISTKLEIEPFRQTRTAFRLSIKSTIRPKGPAIRIVFSSGGNKGGASRFFLVGRVPDFSHVQTRLPFFGTLGSLPFAPRALSVPWRQYQEGLPAVKQGGRIAAPRELLENCTINFCAVRVPCTRRGLQN